MTDYSEVVKNWIKFYNCYQLSYYYNDMPFFRHIMLYFYKNNGKDYITPEEMKELIIHYKNAFNDFKHNSYNTYYRILRKKIQSEYERLLQIYDDLLNIESMKNGKNRQVQ